jgi:ribulose-bisphosphate carboxylase large chain
MSWIDVTYRICAARDQLEGIAHALALEQSVEVSAEVVTDPFVAENIMGRVAEVHPSDNGPHRVVIRLAMATTGFDVAQTVNMLFSNSSLHAHVELVDVEFPPEFLTRFSGPDTASMASVADCRQHVVRSRVRHSSRRACRARH